MADVIALLQFVASIIGGGFALYLFRQSNREKRHQLLAELYNRLYNDAGISDLLYALDKNRGMERLRSGGTLERSADKGLHLLNFIGGLVKQDSLYWQDLDSFRYVITLLLGLECGKDGKLTPSALVMAAYVNHLIDNNIHFPDLNYLIKEKPHTLGSRFFALLN